MIFKKLIIKDGLFDKSEDIYYEKRNLFYSKDNSVGKTTYLRIMLYAFGYTVPNMFGINFSDLELELIINEGNIDYTIKRIEDVLYVESENFSVNFVLPDEHIKFLSMIFKTDNRNVLENLLGLIYIDQDKGWTLLNRGTVIGRYKFNVETLLSGLGDIDCTEEIESREYYEKENKKGNALLNLKKLQDEILESNNDYIFTDYEKELNDRVELLNIRIVKIKEDIKKIDEVLNKNNSIYNYINQMKLYVVDSNGKEIAVNSKNLRNANETNNLLEYRKRYLSIELKNEESKLKELRNKQKEYYKESGNNKLFVTEEKINDEIAKKSISNLDIDAMSINAIIKSNKDTIDKLNISINEKLAKNYKLNEKIYIKIRDYCDFLGISDRILDNPNFLLTRNIKNYSGTDFSKLVIAFRLALHRATEEYLGTSIPLIIDSPTGKEITEKNYIRILELVESELSNSQIMYASIYDLSSDKKFLFNKKAIENHSI